MIACIDRWIDRLCCDDSENKQAARLRSRKETGARAESSVFQTEKLDKLFKLGI